MICERCGTQSDNGARVCPRCGAPLHVYTGKSGVASIRQGRSHEPPRVYGAMPERPAARECVLTAHQPPQWMLDEADYVTEMKCHRHPYQKGVPARKGIEY